MIKIFKRNDWWKKPQANHITLCYFILFTWCLGVIVGRFLQSMWWFLTLITILIVLFLKVSVFFIGILCIIWEVSIQLLNNGILLLSSLILLFTWFVVDLIWLLRGQQSHIGRERSSSIYMEFKHITFTTNNIPAISCRLSFYKYWLS